MFSEEIRNIIILILLIPLGVVVGFFYGFMRATEIKRETERPANRSSKEIGDRDVGKKYLLTDGRAEKDNLLKEFLYAMYQRNVPNVRLVHGTFVDEEMHTSHDAIYVDTIIGKTLVSFPVLVSDYGAQDLHYSWLTSTKRRKSSSVVPKHGWGCVALLLFWPVLFFAIPFDVVSSIVCNRDSEVRMSKSKRYSEEAIQAAIANLSATVEAVFMEAVDEVGIGSDAIHEIIPPPIIGKRPLRVYG